MNKPKAALASIAQAGMLMPEEQLLAVKPKNTSLKIGIPKESSISENRIALVPDAVSLMVNNGHEILFEAGAGASSNFPDNSYSEAGAKICYSPEDVYAADIILKVAPPTIEELKYMRPKQTLISILQTSNINQAYVKELAAKQITALAYEYLQDKSGQFPIIRAMSEIVGSTSIMIAADYLSNAHNGKGKMLGGVAGISPSEVVILGAGTVGEYAARAAMGLGAIVKVFDNSIYKLRRLQYNLGQRIYTSIIVPNYLQNVLRTADVVVGAMLAKEGRTPCIVTDAMVSHMKAGSVIVDVSIDQGGCFETSRLTSHANPIFREHDVIHYCVPNIASRVSRTASYALSNIFAPILFEIASSGGLDEILWDDIGVRRGIYMYRGHITNRYVSDLTKQSYKDLDLLLATRRF